MAEKTLLARDANRQTREKWGVGKQNSMLEGIG